MNLALPQGRLDEAAAVNGDRFFLGIDERQSPQQLPEGMGSYGQNLRFRRGRAATRKGVQLCPWMKDDGRTPWTEVYGGIVFSDPNQDGDWFIIAADGGVWKTRPNMTAQAVPLPTGITLTAETFQMFVPCTDGGAGVLVLLRGPEADPLVCANLDAGFSAVPAHVGGTRDMPRSSWGLNHLNRLLLIEGKDIVAASDILAYQDFVAVTNQYRINPGNSQALLALQPMPNGTLLCFKTQSVLQVTGVRNDVDENGDPILAGFGPDPVTESYGLAGPLAKTRKGANCIWVTNEPSLTSLRLTELNETQDTDLRLSDPAEQTFGRINPLYLDRICVETWNGCKYVALPLDDATILDAALSPTSFEDLGGNRVYYFATTPGQRYQWTPGSALTLTNDEEQLTQAAAFVARTGQVAVAYAGTPALDSQVQRIKQGNTAVAVFDDVTGAYCGVDEAPGVFAVKAFLKASYLGRQRLFLLGVDGTLRLYEEGFEDEIMDAAGDFVSQAIPTVFRSRGYALANGDRGRAVAAKAQVATWAPNFALHSLTPGYNSTETERTGITRSRTTYDVHDRPDWDPSNDADDHGTPGRQDYSVVLPDAGMNLGSGVDLDAHQLSDVRTPLSRTGDWQQVEVRNSAGRLELINLTTEHTTADREGGISAV